VEAVLAHFRNGGFRYTLEPPLLGRDTVDEFPCSAAARFLRALRLGVRRADARARRSGSGRHGYQGGGRTRSTAS